MPVESILQTGHGVGEGARPVVYRFRSSSPVSPSIANGVMLSVVNVACRGKRGAAIATACPAPTKRASGAARIILTFIGFLLSGRSLLIADVCRCRTREIRVQNVIDHQVVLLLKARMRDVGY